MKMFGLLFCLFVFNTVYPYPPGILHRHGAIRTIIVYSPVAPFTNMV